MVQRLSHCAKVCV